MPIYEYRCENGHEFEVLQAMSDDPVATCEQCAAPVERVFHPIAVHFKGSGFYTTDYAKKGKSGAEASKDGDSGSSSGESKGEGNSGSSSDSGSGSDSSSSSDSSSGEKKADSGTKAKTSASD
jgi:putative FmdB family regulatory protein